MSKRIKKLDQLDSLRAIAAIFVIVFHFLPDFDLGEFNVGWVGVDIFFVISGYLITAILLEQKEVFTNKLLIIKNFVIKRALRLFPVYYLFITFFLVLKLTTGLYVWDTGNEIFFYTYTQNLMFFREGMKGIQVNATWTLAVEEQFYLFWPWMVIYVSNNNLIRGLVAIIIMTIFFKGFVELPNIRMFTVSHFDTLGSGALIALLLKEKGEQVFSFINRYKLILITASFGIFAASSYYDLHKLIIVISILVFSTTTIIGCYFNFNGIPGRILDISQLKYLGKISYGLYLYHRPVGYFLNLFKNQFKLQVNNLILFILSLVLTFLVAHLSYILIEKRFLRLKEKFDL